MFKHAGLAALLVLLLAAGSATAERFERFEDYQIHYNAVGTAVLEPQVAQAYDIVRSRNRGLLTLSVLKDGAPVPAQVEAEALQLNDKLQRIAMREIQEGEAVYYIGTFDVANQDKLRFRLDVRPRDHDREYELRFEQRFFTE